MHNFLKSLNPQQLQAATTVNGPVSILAGAGSGKTKTLIARTAYILTERLCEPANILVMTFTNKAAREMRERGRNILEEIGFDTTHMPNFTTFHSWGVRFIKSMPERILNRYSLSDKPTIIDDTEQESVLKKLMVQIYTKKEYETMKVNDFLLPFTNIQNKLIPYDNEVETFRLLKELRTNNSLDNYKTVNLEDDLMLQKFAMLYIKYKELIRKNNCVDFDDLINISIKILQDFPTIKEKYRAFYRYIMIDEFQDTNYAQIVLMNLLLNEDLNICVVGDDSQSIYGWRGAEISYILNFHKEYKEVVSVNLNINYRSDKQIVNMANTLLTRATQKHELKEALNAFSNHQGNIEGRFFKREDQAYKNSDNEAKYVARKIKSILNNGRKPGEIAVLYRSGAINRKIEMELLAERIPYKIHKGRTILDRKVAQAIISYLKFIINPSNDIALETILIESGVLTDNRTFQFLQTAEGLGISLFEYLKRNNFSSESRLTAKTKTQIERVVLEVTEFIEAQTDDKYKNFIKTFFVNNSVSLKRHEIQMSGNETQRTTALSELRVLSVIETLLLRYESLEEGLEILMLEGEEEDKEDNKVNLMTIHASKGLEFEYVFVVGMSKGIFPSANSITFEQREEERRLAYVAFTRAKNELYLSGSNNYFGGNLHVISDYFEESGIPVVVC